jgi:hypothetical protein
MRGRLVGFWKEVPLIRALLYRVVLVVLRLRPLTMAELGS